MNTGKSRIEYLDEEIKRLEQKIKQQQDPIRKAVQCDYLVTLKRAKTLKVEELGENSVACPENSV